MVPWPPIIPRTLQHFSWLVRLAPAPFSRVQTLASLHPQSLARGRWGETISTECVLK